MSKGTNNADDGPSDLDFSDCGDAPVSKGAAQIKYEQALLDVKRKEGELTKCTMMFEDILKIFTEAISNARASATATSTPRAPGNAPPLNFSSPTGPSFLATEAPPEFTTSNITALSGTSAYSKTYIRDALELVPKYDGHNIPVWQFARACKRAKESIGVVDEAVFVRMLRNKLSHHAYLAVEDETHLTVDKLLDALKRTFGPNRDSNYYRGQLSNAYKKPGEHILDYIGRIKDLRTAIIEGDQTNLNRSLTEAESSAIDAYALEAFYEGLPRDYRIELKAEGYSCLSDACSKTITIQKRLEREEARYRSGQNPRDRSAAIQGPPPVRVAQRDAPFVPSTQNTDRQTAVSGTPNITGQKICGYCKNFGHVINECRKRQYNENNSKARSTNDPQRSGNRPEVSAGGTQRGLASTRPAFPLEYTPEPCTSSGRTTE